MRRTRLAAAIGDIIALVGATPQNRRRDTLGIFKKRPEAVNGWPSYALLGDDGTRLWHAGRCWFVGAAAECGQAKGWISADDGSLTPDQVSATWQVFDGSAWLDAPELRLIAGEALASALAAAADTVALVGATPQNRQRAWLGIFKRRPEAVNGWPSYALLGDDGTRLWHAGRCWYVGAAAKCGQAKGWINAADGSLTPEQVAATWQVTDGSAWFDAPELRCSATWEVFDGSGKRWVRVPGSLAAAAADDEVTVVGERTREEKDREGRKRAIDLEETPCKRRKGDVDERVATARSLCSAETDARYKQLIQAHALRAAPARAPRPTPKTTTTSTRARGVSVPLPRGSPRLTIG